MWKTYPAEKRPRGNDRNGQTNCSESNPSSIIVSRGSRGLCKLAGHRLGVVRLQSSLERQSLVKPTCRSDACTIRRGFHRISWERTNARKIHAVWRSSQCSRRSRYFRYRSSLCSQLGNSGTSRQSSWSLNPVQPILLGATSHTSGPSSRHPASGPSFSNSNTLGYQRSRISRNISHAQTTQGRA